jgi:hypothetical protein
MAHIVLTKEGEVTYAMPSYAWAMIESDFKWEPEEGVLGIFRFNDHADPMFCAKCTGTCNHPQHNQSGKFFDHEFVYDRQNPRNRIKKDFVGYTDYA